MAAVEPKFWTRFRELTGLEELSDDDGLSDGSRGDEVKKIILSAISTRSASDWKQIFGGEDVCVDVLEPTK
jgi:crotonobetainyl-CoA:carnitine CoA-transferase CaiB-like acyl-CoA transferase